MSDNSNCDICSEGEMTRNHLLVNFKELASMKPDSRIN